jgi:hypothetical protein
VKTNEGGQTLVSLRLGDRIVGFGLASRDTAGTSSLQIVPRNGNAAALRRAAADRRRVRVHLTVHDWAGNKRIYDHRAAVALAMEAENVSRGPGVARRAPRHCVVGRDRTPWLGRKRSCGSTAALAYGRAARSSSRSRRAPRQTGPDWRSSRRHARCRTARSAAADRWFRGGAAVLTCAPACGFPPVARGWSSRASVSGAIAVAVVARAADLARQRAVR